MKQLYKIEKTEANGDTINLVNDGMPYSDCMLLIGDLMYVDSRLSEKSSYKIIPLNEK